MRCHPRLFTIMDNGLAENQKWGGGGGGGAIIIDDSEEHETSLTQSLLYCTYFSQSGPSSDNIFYERRQDPNSTKSMP